MNRQIEPLTPDTLAVALGNPLPRPLSGSAAEDLLASLRHHLPLWSLQPYAYAALQESDAPVTFPLQTIVTSLHLDDGITNRSGGELDPPLATVQKRRAWLAGWSDEAPTGDASFEWVVEDGDPVQLRSGEPFSDRVPVLYDPDEQYGGLHYVPAADEAEAIGERIIGLLDRRESARGRGDSEELEAAERDLQAFLRDLGVYSYGRPSEGPDEQLVQQLYEEGEELSQLCWEVWPPNPSSETREVLIEHGVAETDCWLWATALTLPVLSRLEIRALDQQIFAAQDWGDRPLRPTPRRFTVHVLSHRLRMDQSAIARRIWESGGAVEEFQRARDPFETIEDS